MKITNPFLEELGMPKVILNVKNLTVERNEEDVIKDLTFEVMEGEVLVFLDPNGAGSARLMNS